MLGHGKTELNLHDGVPRNAQDVCTRGTSKAARTHAPAAKEISTQHWRTAPRLKQVARRVQTNFWRGKVDGFAPLRRRQRRGNRGQGHGNAAGEQDNGTAVFDRRNRVVMQLPMENRARRKQAQGENQGGTARRQQATKAISTRRWSRIAQAAPPS